MQVLSNLWACVLNCTNNKSGPCNSQVHESHAWNSEERILEDLEQFPVPQPVGSPQERGKSCLLWCSMAARPAFQASVGPVRRSGWVPLVKLSFTRLFWVLTLYHGLYRLAGEYSPPSQTGSVSCKSSASLFLAVYCKYPISKRLTRNFIETCSSHWTVFQLFVSSV